MLYSNIIRFHISIISIRWYKNNILTKLNSNILEILPVLIAVKPFDTAILYIVDLKNNMEKVSYKKKIKSSIKMVRKKKVMHETLNYVNIQETNDSGIILRSQ
ncbi:hypothetical protein RhiirA1_454843 [Rhizophagus irregularis]|uniref:Uncharacterized protein n=1 Tax=Rhizophagus irregularis TaxID=588596 RepID=A0A2N0S486_9GLOM|nr:hypothetical protein RhiirA1_454843 [Rhizophagus irregularis]